MCMQYRCAVKTCSEESPPPRLLDQVRERARYLHYSLRTEKAYVYWIRMFVRWSGLRHPREMGEPEVKAFLTMLATQRRISSSTHNQALSALLFLYREVLGSQLPWMADLQRPSHVKRIPTVLTREDNKALLTVVSSQGQQGQGSDVAQQSLGAAASADLALAQDLGA